MKLCFTKPGFIKLFYETILKYIGNIFSETGVIKNNKKMADIKKTAACAIVIALSVKRKQRIQNRGRNRSIWTREWILKRPQQGAYHQLIQELQLTDHVI